MAKQVEDDEGTNGSGAYQPSSYKPKSAKPYIAVGIAIGIAIAVYFIFK
jgi:hypothetical protein